MRECFGSLKMQIIRSGSCLLVLLFAGCGSPDPDPKFGKSGEPLVRSGDEISICGELFHTGAKVILWNDTNGYDAYRVHQHFSPDKKGTRQNPSQVTRYGSFRGGLSKELRQKVRTRGWKLEELQSVISLVVIHFDACGTSKKCFEVLQDDRGLSCHFLLDVDGTIYQTLDLKERAWHAADANDVSIGIEIANVGARKKKEDLKKYYSKDSEGTRFIIPKAAQGGGLSADFVPRPARKDLIEGTAHGKPYVQYDFTEQQYESLEKLLVTLCRLFPKVNPRAPVGKDGKVIDGLVPGEKGWRAHEGLIGHQHLTTHKIDPGPAFDWERIHKALDKAGL